MPYEGRGRVIFHWTGSKWEVKQTAKNITNAKKAMKLLNMLEHS
jgi:hypothetical protein